MTSTPDRHEKPLTDATIGFIGGGNMAGAMIGGLLANGFPAGNIRVSDPDPAQRESLAAAFSGIDVIDDNSALLAVDVCVLAVKPQILHAVSRELAAGDQRGDTLFVSIAAGVRSQDIERWLGGTRAVVRAMPNQGAMVGRSATAVFANTHCSDAQRALADFALAAMGRVFWLDNESDIDGATAIAGSGPAYFFLLMEMLHETARAFGLEDPAARDMVIETATAAAALAARPGNELAALRASVTSKGGTTAAAIDHLLHNDIENLFRNALGAARDRAAALADDAAKHQG